jgi:4-diphosphocytidyl-2-C-methyl-D-erythritol kinase
MVEPAAVSWPAPAKINLFLRITGRRADGYHELQTLFQLLDWGDEVRLAVRDDAGVTGNGPDYGVSEHEDLAVRAARLLQDETGCRLGADIRVTKRVPPGSGMGGGSSDAATVLAVLNRLWECGLTIDELAELGAGLGADVPVFVRGRSALASGVGERLEPVRLGERHYVLVFPGIHISTRAVFQDPELRRDSRPVDTGAVLGHAWRNDCEALVRKRFPAMDEAFRRLARWGRPMMTGTGSGIFIEVAAKSEAIASAHEIKSLYNSRAATGVDESPLHVKLYGGGA